MSQVFEFSHLKEAITTLSLQIRRQDFLTYFKKFSLISVTEDQVTLWVVSSFHRDNLASKFYEEIKGAIITIHPSIISVDIVVDDAIESKDETQVIDCRVSLKDQEKVTKKQHIEGVEIVDGINSRLINDRYRLDNFIVGPTTQLAHAASEAVARKPGASYNPLYLYGNVGLGKTHLLQGTANAIRSKHKHLKVVYTTADRFLTDYVASIKSRSVDKLREKYRAIDVLVIDDVQFLAWKKQTQEDLGEPDYETRLAIVQEKSRAREFLLPAEVAEFIAENVTTNVREIEWILNQIIAEYDLKNTPPTLENVAYRLSKLAVRSISTSLTEGRSIRMGQCSYEGLIQAVSGHFGIEIRMLLSEDRKKENMIPRQVAMYLLKNRLHYTYERIGNIFSGRNHTAVMYSCKKLEQVMKKDQQVIHEVNIIRDKLGI